MPNFILTIFQLMSYAIPREDVSDRLAYHVTVLLAMFAGKLVTVGMLPITSYLTFIDWYMFASYIFVVAIALEVSITKLLVDLPPHAYIEEHALTTTDHVRAGRPVQAKALISHPACATEAHCLG